MAGGGPDHADREDRAERLTDSELAGLILDEAFVRGAAVKEPAAAERDTAGPIVAPPRPPRLRLTSPPLAHGPLAWLRRRLPTIIVVLLIAAMVLGSVGPFASRRPSNNASDEDGDAEAPASRQPASLFAGTPARQFADGDAGLVLPAASAVGGLETHEVALALHAVRRAVSAANLDEVVITGASPAPYVDVVSAATGARLKQAEAEGAAGRTTDFVTQFPPAHVDLVPGATKVSGSLTYDADGPDALRVEARHLFVYAAIPAGQAGADGTVELVAVRRDTTWKVARGPEGVAKPELVKTEMATSGHCLAGAGDYVWPRFTNPDRPVRSGTAVPVAWNLTEPLVGGIDCFEPLASQT